ncbi:hypothetical protein CVO76_12835 [Arthrobacter agilis]|uniref:DUF5134 domain-containing protein n=1 Tax=Arthrobacter agilis TaxID=37921 RepID=A0A2L0UGR3_9MICC|nr:hypothetical protein [Arthrobacter agilis]AUZ88422.1 hypothetical protein CVO76_12835 [Arthrobacter agilis]
MNTSLSAIMLLSAAAGFAVCVRGLVPRGRRRLVGSMAGPVGGRTPGLRDGWSPGEPADVGRTPGSAVVGMAVMLVAMADMAFDAVYLLPGVVWGVVLLLAGPLLLVGGRSTAGPAPCGFGMHRSLSMIAMAALTITGGHADDAGRGATTHAGHAHGGPTLLPVLLAAGVAALLAYTVVLVVAHRRTHRDDARRGSRFLPRAGVESCLAAVSVAAMAASMVA